MDEIKSSIYNVVARDKPMTVRQVFYRLVSVGTIGKTEAEYKGTVVRLLSQMRRNGELPFSWIADNTRWMRKPSSHSSLEEFMAMTNRTYRRDIWDRQEAYVEVWLEKEALAGVLYEVTEEWDVPLMVTRGYPSLTFLHSAGQAIGVEDRPCFLYYFGDYDPSGVNIEETVEQGIEDFGGGADVTFERVAVTPQQISLYNLQTRPTKRSDSRSRGWEGGSVEVDAIPPTELRNLVRDCIQRHVDQRAYELVRYVEQEERRLLTTFMQTAEVLAGVQEISDLEERGYGPTSRAGW